MTTLVLQISLKDKSFHIFINSLGLYLSAEFLLDFLSKSYIPPCVGKIFKFMEFTFLENAFIRGIFTHALPTQNSPPTSCHLVLGRKKLVIPPGSILSKMCFPQQQKGVEGTMICFIKRFIKRFKTIQYGLEKSIFPNLLTTSNMVIATQTPSRKAEKTCEKLMILRENSKILEE